MNGRCLGPTATCDIREVKEKHNNERNSLVRLAEIRVLGSRCWREKGTMDVVSRGLASVCFLQIHAPFCAGVGGSWNVGALSRDGLAALAF